MKVAPTNGEKAPWLARLNEAQWARFDYLFAGFLLAGSISYLFIFPHGAHAHLTMHLRPILLPFYLLATIPIAFRRRWPLQTLTIICIAVSITILLGPSLASLPLTVLPLYSVTMAYTRRQSFIALMVVESILGTSFLISWVMGRDQGDFSSNIFLAVATWFVADSIRTKRIYLRGLEAQAQERQRQEIDGARRAIVEERLAIARELHDVVAHSLSVIAVQSGVGRHVIDTQPEEARNALLAVEVTSRSALDELRGVLGVLRGQDRSTTELSPAPSLNDLDELIRRVRSAGVTVEMHIEGRHEPLSPGLELSIYRIIQEALTNVVKHANGAHTSIEIQYTNDEITIEVTNQKGNEVSIESGVQVLMQDTSRDRHGIVGMKERALAFGGTLWAKPLNDGGFKVSAALPTKAQL